ncbi:MAG: glutamate dehydrogenase, partial [Gemmatimonadetes bacterium]|nr:glutamate dehydrogenase [Gemmatimonadota bacterium]
DGGVQNEGGLDVPALREHVRRARTVAGFAGGQAITNQELWRIPCDFLIPAALGGVINKEENVQDLDCRMVVEAANGPTTPIADKVLAERDIPVLPDFLANAGGVVVSYFEWTQNLQQMTWELEQVYAGLEKKMVASYRAVIEAMRQHSVSLRTAAYMIALRRVAEAEELRGH